jgi:hypothetical protein
MHIQLIHVLDSMLRNGYIGRAPRTRGHIAIFQEVYERQKKGETFRQSANSITPQLSTALIGVSGMGKTTTVARWACHIPPVIYHPEFGIFQVPVLHIEMPSDGSSTKGLGLRILHRMDELIPGANYYEQYGQNPKIGADALMGSVARVLNMHFVGLLIPDEVQNLTNSPKGSQVLMSELVSASNILKLPILFLGTNKSQKILSTDFRQGRRSCGGLDNWDRFHEYDESTLPKDNSTQFNSRGEWDQFMDVLWTYQWIRNPEPLSDALGKLMYFYSQGVIGIAILLFMSVQARAIADGTEKITAELITSAYNRELKLLHKMLDALRRNDLLALAEFDDIAPYGIDGVFGNIERQIRYKKHSSSARVKPAQVVAEPVAVALTASGYSPEDALAVATEITERQPGISTPAAVKKGLALLAPLMPVKSASKNSNADTLLNYDFTGRTNDYRKAIKEAKLRNTTVLEQLKELGMIKNLDQILEI